MNPFTQKFPDYFAAFALLGVQYAPPHFSRYAAKDLLRRMHAGCPGCLCGIWYLQYSHQPEKSGTEGRLCH